MDNKIVKKPELLVPASSLEVLKIAVVFGADAVYIGGEAFGLRAKAKNFTPEEMADRHSVKLMGTGVAPRHSRVLVNKAEEVARSWWPFRSSGVVTSRLVTTLRKPKE